MPYQSTFMLGYSVAAQIHIIVREALIFLFVCWCVYTLGVCQQGSLSASAASTMFYKANRKIFSTKVNIRCVIMEDVA